MFAAKWARFSFFLTQIIESVRHLNSFLYETIYEKVELHFLEHAIEPSNSWNRLLPAQSMAGVAVSSDLFQISGKVGLYTLYLFEILNGMVAVVKTLASYTEG